MRDTNYLRQAWAGRRSAASLRIEIAALELFCERGVDQVSAEDIARSIGISRRTFYRHFRTAEDVLSAMPRRSLARLANDVLARPCEESLRDAFIGASRDARISDDERHVQRLCAQIFAKDPTAWWRAIARMQPSTRDAYKEIVTERLKRCGADDSNAGLVGAVLHAVMDEAGKDFRQGDPIEENVRRIERAFDVVVGTLSR